MKLKKQKTRAIERLTELGWTAGDVESHQRHSFTTNDLFGFIDVIAIKGKKTLALQVTDTTSVCKRVDKMLAEERLATCLKAGWLVEAWGVRNKPARDGSFALARYFELSDGGATVTAYEGSSILKG